MRAQLTEVLDKITPMVAPGNDALVADLVALRAECSDNAYCHWHKMSQILETHLGTPDPPLPWHVQISEVLKETW